MVEFAIFLASLAAPLAIVGAALAYLRPITRNVLREQCASDAGAEYWLRTVDVLAFAGTAILVLAFGRVGDADPLVQLRLTLGLALAGVFIAVAVVASNVWRTVKREAPARTAAEDALWSD